MNMSFSVVTGATGYSGKYITQKLLARGVRVKSLTNHLGRANPFGDQVEMLAYNFENKAALTQCLRGATTLYNTYWVRFSRGRVTFDQAVRNTQILLEAAKEAGVKKIVQVSIANPNENTHLPYYRGKAMLEKAVMESGLSYAIVRPTVIFGPEDILINNIAWLLRASPVFAVAGSGAYGVQPIFVEDMAELCITLAGQTQDVIVDAVGPETFKFIELVRLIRDKVGSRAKILHVPAGLLLAASHVMGALVGDVLLTQEEIDGLIANVLVSKQAPTGKTRFTEWAEANRGILGKRYTSELKRHYLSKKEIRT